MHVAVFVPEWEFCRPENSSKICHKTNYERIKFILMVIRTHFPEVFQINVKF